MNNPLFLAAQPKVLTLAKPQGPMTASSRALHLGAREFLSGLPTRNDATAKDALVALRLVKAETPRNSLIHHLLPVGGAGFAMAKTTRIAHSCSMKIAEDIRKYAAEQGIAEAEALKNGMEEKSREFTKKGSELYVKA